MDSKRGTGPSQLEPTLEGCSSHQAASPTVGPGETGLHPSTVKTHTGHYHAQELGPDVLVTPCIERHRAAINGRSIELCGTGSAQTVVFPAISAPAMLSEIEGIRLGFRCKSWRCDRCRKFCFGRDYARVATGLEARPTWLFVVLGFNQARWTGGSRSCWKNAWRPIQRLRQRLARVVGGSVEFISTMEQHKSGWPHANLAIRFDLLDRVEPEDLDEFARCVERWIKDTGPSVGLGHSVYCEVLDGAGRAAAYFSKLAGEKQTPGPGIAAREMVKTSQVPLDAPLGIRRIRASRGVLPSLRRAAQGLGTAILRTSSAKGKPGEPGPTVGGSVRGVRGAEPPASGPEPGSDGKEQFTAVPGKQGSRRSTVPPGNPKKRQDWWKIASSARKRLESIGTMSSSQISVEIAAIKAKFDQNAT